MFPILLEVRRGLGECSSAGGGEKRNVWTGCRREKKTLPEPSPSPVRAYMRGGPYAKHSGARNREKRTFPAAPPP